MSLKEIKEKEKFNKKEKIKNNSKGNHTVKLKSQYYMFGCNSFFSMWFKRQMNKTIITHPC